MSVDQLLHRCLAGKWAQLLITASYYLSQKAMVESLVMPINSCMKHLCTVEPVRTTRTYKYKRPLMEISLEKVLFHHRDLNPRPSDSCLLAGVYLPSLQVLASLNIFGHFTVAY